MNKSVYAYEFDNKLYINLTNGCPNRCSFCIRNIKDGVNGSPLWLREKATYDRVISAIEKFDLTKYPQVVFCGFGEPTCELKLLCEVGKYLKKQNKEIRLNTNGLSNEINKIENSAEMLKGIVDKISISLNASTEEKYQEICKSKIKHPLSALIKFTKQCVTAGINTTLSVVDTIGEEEIERCREIADSLGAKLRVRALIKENDKY